MIQKLQNNQKGFTLIELMIVIAIIGILAAIAVPQFMAYRMRGYHSVAASDVRNWVAAEAALYEDGACYGMSDAGVGVNLTAAGGTGAAATLGNLVVGGNTHEESVAATALVDGTLVTGSRTNNLGIVMDFAFPISVGDDVKLRADVSISTAANPADTTPYNDSFIIVGEHRKGIRAFGADSDITNALFFVQNDTWANTAPGALNPTVPAAITGGLPNSDGFTADGTGFNGGGLPNTLWDIMK